MDFNMEPSPTKNHPDKRRAVRINDPEAVKIIEQKLSNAIANPGVDNGASALFKEDESEVIDWIKKELAPVEKRSASKTGKIDDQIEEELAKNTNSENNSSSQKEISPSPTPPIEAIEIEKQETEKESPLSAVESNPEKKDIDWKVVMRLVASRL